MIYKLAKQLKESGFPQKEKGTMLFAEGVSLADSQKVWNEKGAYAPTLEEVIEELGDNFRKLIRGAENYWEALSNNEIDIGKTPLEAVSNLYIKLTRNNKA